MASDRAPPRTLREAILFFADYDNCRKAVEAIRWPDGVVRCPRCDSDKVTYLAKARVWKCYGDHPRQKFSLKVGTIFEDSAIGFEKWLPALWLLTNCKNGISSYELARALGVTQKTAWFMLARLRMALHGGEPTDKFTRITEADETYIGGKARNMHLAKKKRLNVRRGRTIAGKVAVMARSTGTVRMVSRRFALKCSATSNSGTCRTMSASMCWKVRPLHTDAFKSYTGLYPEYTHKVIDHAEAYVGAGNVHTNSCENFWSLLKRAIKGTYVSIEPFHLFRYLDEQALRFNNRKGTDAMRFALALKGIINKRLTYSALTGSELPQTC